MFEVPIERQQAGALVDRGRGDPHVVCRNWPSGFSECCVDTSVVSSNISGDWNDFDKRFAEEVREGDAILLGARSEIERAMKFAEHSRRHQDDFCRSKKIVHARIARSEARVCGRVENEAGRRVALDRG